MANYLTVIHECKDFAVWRKAYDADRSGRAAAGLTELYLVREQANRNLIGIVFEASDVDRAKAMVASPELASTMKAAGVIGTPIARLRHGELQAQSAANFATITLNVRDYETARQAYATDADDRRAAGLIDLSVLQLNDDPNNLLLFWAVSDLGRAMAFLDSPKLADHMVNNAGVVGFPERHLWWKA